jgi:hypothetical protein
MASFDQLLHRGHLQLGLLQVMGLQKQPFLPGYLAVPGHLIPIALKKYVAVNPVPGL